MGDQELRQQMLDEEHLRLLSIGYKISAGITAFYALFGLMYIGMGLMFSFVPVESGAGDPPPAFFALLMSIIGAAFLLVGFGLAALKWRTGQLLIQHRSLVFCQVIAALSCLEVPYGTALGVFTFIVLGRPSVRRLFDQAVAA